MKQVPKKQEQEVGGGDILYEPWCPQPGDPMFPPGDLGYPTMPGCPDPTIPVVDPTPI